VGSERKKRRTGSRSDQKQGLRERYGGERASIDVACDWLLLRESCSNVGSTLEPISGRRLRKEAVEDSKRLRRWRASSESQRLAVECQSCGKGDIRTGLHLFGGARGRRKRRLGKEGNRNGAPSLRQLLGKL